MPTRTATYSALAAVAGIAATLLPATLPPAVSAQPKYVPTERHCSPTMSVEGFNDSLDKAQHHGVQVGGLSSLARDQRAHSWVSTVDNQGGQPSRLWFIRDLTHPTLEREPLVLKKPDGTAYDGKTADNEGLAVLPNGDYLVSSENEPSIRIFGRDGVEKASLPIPPRFAVAPHGQAKANATLEGLTIMPSGRQIVVAMEGALSGDVPPSGDDTLHRFLVYNADAQGRWTLGKEIAYRTNPGMRVAEVSAYGKDSLLVQEASFSKEAGNAVSLYAVTGLDRAADVTRVNSAPQAPAETVVPKTLVADLVACPSMGAPTKQPQTNPLLDNLEGMAVTGPRRAGATGISMISDDNFEAKQTTRVINLVANLP